MFGYDAGILGGIIAQEDFVQRFFPGVSTMPESSNNVYCSTEYLLLSFWVGLFFLGMMFGSIVGSFLSKRLGRLILMRISGFLLVIAYALYCAGVNVTMMFVARSIQGTAIGFGSQCVPVFLAEVSPVEIRGSISSLYGFGASFGTFGGNLINLAVHSVNQAWRISFGIGIIPSAVLFVGSFFISDSPHSLLPRGQVKEAEEALSIYRKKTETGSIGMVSTEFESLVNEVDLEQHSNPWKLILMKKYRGQLCTPILVAFFATFSGLEAQFYFAPAIFNLLTDNLTASLGYISLVGFMFVAGSIAHTLFADQISRRRTLVVGALLMALAQSVEAVLFAVFIPDGATEYLSSGQAWGIVVTLMAFIFSWSWSWGPISFAIAAETQSLVTRDVGSSINVIVQSLCNFVLAFAYSSMICSWKYGTNVFFACICAVSIVYTMALLPETLHIDLVDSVTLFKDHWFWGRFVPSMEIKRRSHLVPGHSDGLCMSTRTRIPL